MTTQPSGAELARQLGLKKVGGRPPLVRYVRQIWDRRYFTLSWARGRAYAKNQGNYLGQLWNFLTPLLWAGLYYFVFGVVLGADRGVENFAAYLVTGLFIFRFISHSMNGGAGSMAKNETLISSLQFPRALVPLTVATAEFFTLIPAIIVLFAVALATGEPIRIQMLLFAPAVALAYVFACAMAMIAARLVHEVVDLGQLIPFINRMTLYVSGVMFPLTRYGDGTLYTVMTYQPYAVYLQLARSALLEEVPVEPHMWLWGLGWAVLFVVLGLVFFWRAEARYGRG